MKKIFLFTLILISNHIFAQNNTASFDINCNVWKTTIDQSGPNNFESSVFNWQPVSTPGSFQMLDVFFIDSLYGWVSHTGNGGLRTTNSGFNWETFSFADTTFSTLYNGLYFLDRNTGWCVGGALEIRKTTNGGINWFRQVSPPVAGIAHSVYFFNANTGYVVGSKNFPYQPFITKTTNGGNNWIEIPSGSGQELNEEFWINENTGWIAGYDVLLYTSNGGETFSSLFGNLPPTANGHSALLSIYFANSLTGWIGAANLERNNIYKTTNGGMNWFFQTNPVSEMGWNQINDVRFISADSGWAVHGTPGTGAIMFTSNGGTNWIMDNTQYSWYDCLETYHHSKVWCGGSDGIVWYCNLQGPVGINQNAYNLSNGFQLMQNYPNPFNSNTIISYYLPGNNFVSLKIYDILGNEIEDLVNGKQDAGNHRVSFDAQALPSGVYYYKLASGAFTQTKEMILIK